MARARVKSWFQSFVQSYSMYSSPCLMLVLSWSEDGRGLTVAALGFVGHADHRCKVKCARA